MGILSSLTGIKNDLFGEDSEITTSTGPTSGTKTTIDSGTSGTSSTTKGATSTNTSGTQTSINSGSTNTSNTINSGSVNTVTNSGSTNTTTVGPSTIRTSARVDTQQLQIDKAGVDRMLQQILEGTGGLADTLGASRGLGVYNSTVDTLLGNDLLARVAGEIGARTGVLRTVTGGTTTTNSGNTTTQNIGSSTQTQNIGGSTSSSTQNIGGSQSTTYTNANSNTGESTDTTKFQTNPRTVTENASTSGTQVKQDNDKSGLLDWIICTELHRQGRMSDSLYRVGGIKFLKYSDEILKGYYIWAVPSTKHLRAHPESKYSKFLEIIFNSRGRALASRGCIVDHIVAGAIYALCLILSKTIATNYSYSRELLRSV